MLSRKYKVEVTLLSQILNKEYGEEFKITITKRFNNWWMFIKVDFIQMLAKTEIVESDITEINKKLDSYLLAVFGESKELIMTRLDYCFNAIVENEDHRKLIFWLLKKTSSKYNHKKKEVRFKTSIYFNSLSVKVLVYDKKVEREDKLLEVKHYEENVIRLEVSLQNRHLNYMKRQYGIEKNLKNYLTSHFWKFYMIKHVSPIFHEGTFYKLDEATKILESTDLSEKERANLRAFLSDVSKHNFDGIKKFKRITINDVEKNKYTKYLVKKYLEQLREVGIHPILIPKHRLKEKSMKNPFNMDL